MLTKKNTIMLTSYILIGIALYFTLKLHLLSALFSGFLVFQIVRQGEITLSKIGVLPRTAEVILLILIAAITIALFGLGIAAAVPYFRGDSELGALMRSMADAVDTVYIHLPAWLQNYIPNSLEEWQAAVSDWLRKNAADISVIGRNIGIFFIHLIVGMLIGGIAAVKNEEEQDEKKNNKGPLAQELINRINLFNIAFRKVVFSQITISAINTLFTSIYLLVIVRLLGYKLPFTASMIVVTFICGLLPIIGNLISNTVIVLVALTVSPVISVSSLLFLIIIHKLEYLINAKIVGNNISAKVWELLVVLLVMEVAFGIPGLIAAPIYYAYIKKELLLHKLI